jgi:hypothetical protein
MGFFAVPAAAAFCRQKPYLGLKSAQMIRHSGQNSLDCRDFVRENWLCA